MTSQYTQWNDTGLHEFKVRLSRIMEEKLPASTVRGHIEKIGEETQELLVAWCEGRPQRINEELADLLLNVLAISVKLSSNIGDDLANVIDLCDRSDFVETKPGIYRRVKGSEDKTADRGVLA